MRIVRRLRYVPARGHARRYPESVSRGSQARPRRCARWRWPGIHSSNGGPSALVLRADSSVSERRWEDRTHGGRHYRQRHRPNLRPCHQCGTVFSVAVEVFVALRPARLPPGWRSTTAPERPSSGSLREGSARRSARALGSAPQISTTSSVAPARSRSRKPPVRAAWSVRRSPISPARSSERPASLATLHDRPGSREPSSPQADGPWGRLWEIR